MSSGDSRAAPEPPATPGAHAFPRARRILKTDEFSSVFHLRPVHRSPHFVLYARASSLPHARLGIVAGKRFAPRAVTRNTIKRLAREVFRQAALPACDCILRLAKPVNTKTEPATSSSLKARLRKELQELFSRPLEGRLADPSPR